MEKKIEIYNALKNYFITWNAATLLRDLRTAHPQALIDEHILRLVDNHDQLIILGPVDDVKWHNLCAFAPAVAVFDHYIRTEQMVVFPGNVCLYVTEDGEHHVGSDIMCDHYTQRQQIKWFNDVVYVTREAHFNH